MAADQRERIEARIAELRDTAGFTVQTAKLAPAASRDVLDQATSAAGGRLPRGVEEFYRQLNGFTLEWSYTKDGADDTGSVNFLPVEEIFSDWFGTTWFDNTPAGSRFKDVKPFDHYITEACAAFRQRPGGSPEDEVYFHYFGEDLAPLSLTFPEYVDLTLATAGYLNWRLALSLDSPGQPEARPTLDRMCEIIPGFTADQLPHNGDE